MNKNKKKSTFPTVHVDRVSNDMTASWHLTVNIYVDIYVVFGSLKLPFIQLFAIKEWLHFFFDCVCFHPVAFMLSYGYMQLCAR